jgi:hypothetical protein
MIRGGLTDHFKQQQELSEIIPELGKYRQTDGSARRSC